MSPPGAHQEYDELAVAWALDALEPSDRALFEQHRDTGCRRCAVTVADALLTAVDLAWALPDREPPPDLRGRVLTAAAMSRAGTPASELSLLEPARPERVVVRARQARHGATSRSRLVPVLAAALVAVSAIATREVVTLRQQAPVTVVADRTADLRATAGGPTLATVVLSGEHAEVRTGLPANSVDRFYVLWGVRAAASSPIALGSFGVTGRSSQTYSVTLVRSPTGYPVLAVSQEPKGSLPAAPSNVLAQGPLDR